MTAVVCASVYLPTVSAAQNKSHVKDTRAATAVYSKRSGTSIKELQSNFAAVGFMRCGSYVGTASLVGDQQTIVTVAHTFRYTAQELRRQICRNKSNTAQYRHFKCKGRIASGLSADAEVGFEIGLDRWRRDIFLPNGKKRRRPTACTFSVRPGGRENARWRTYIIDPKSVSFPEPLRSDDILELLRKDWAVARLLRPVPDVTPFLIAPRKTEEIGDKRLIELMPDAVWEHVGADVVAVSMKFSRRKNAVKRFEDCRVSSAIRDRYRSGTIFFANCYGEPGTSGSLVLQPADMPGRYFVRGVIATVSKDRPKSGRAAKLGLTGGIMMERALANKVRQVLAAGNPKVLLPVRNPSR